MLDHETPFWLVSIRTLAVLLSSFSALQLTELTACCFSLSTSVVSFNFPHALPCPQVQAAVNHSLIHSPNWESLCRADEPKCPRRLFAFHTDVAHRNRPEFLQLRIPEGWTPLPRPEGNESGNEGARMVELALRGPQFLLDHADSMVLGWNDRKPTWSTVTHIVWGPSHPTLRSTHPLHASAPLAAPRRFGLFYAAQALSFRGRGRKQRSRVADTI